MSARNDKKLRKEQAEAKLTPRQAEAKKEAKKLFTQTVVFVVVIAIIFAAVLGVWAYGAIKNSGILQKNITAATIGNRKIPTAVLNYFYLDAIANQYSSWQSSFSTYTDTYLKQYFGLDTTLALDDQYYNEAEKITWADYFIKVAIEDARSCYAIYDKAVENKYVLIGDAYEEYVGWIDNYEYQAEMYGATTDDMIEANYGPGSTFESWKEYLKVVITAQAYANDHAENLTYDDAALRAHEKGREKEYNAYSYLSYHLSYTKYPELGTTGDDDQVTYTDAQKKAALEAAKKDADKLAADLQTAAKDPSTLPEAANGKEPIEIKMNQLIAALPCNENNSSATATNAEDQAYADLNTNLQEWISDSARKAGDITVIANVTTSEEEDGTETSVTNGYFVIYFTGINDNSRPLANVRHLLVQFENGTTDAEGNTVYSDEEKAKAKTEAEKWLEEWKKNPTQEYFIELVKKNSDDTSAADGGLFENISPDDNYVEEFLDWSLDDSRKEGDTGIIETQYGYHVMYYVADDEMTYRDSMISNELKETDHTEWLESITTAVPYELKNTAFLNKDYIIYDNLSSSSSYDLSALGY